MTMMQTQSKKIENPHTWAFRQCLYGRSINIPHFSAKVKEYHDLQFEMFLDRAMQLTDHIAVPSSKLSRHMRRKYAGRRIAIGRNTFYLFSRSKIPADIGAVIDFNERGCTYI